MQISSVVDLFGSTTSASSSNEFRSPAKFLPAAYSASLRSRHSFFPWHLLPLPLRHQPREVGCGASAARTRRRAFARSPARPIRHFAIFSPYCQSSGGLLELLQPWSEVSYDAYETPNHAKCCKSSVILFRSPKPHQPFKISVSSEVFRNFLPVGLRLCQTLDLRKITPHTSSYIFSGHPCDMSQAYVRISHGITVQYRPFFSSLSL